MDFSPLAPSLLGESEHQASSYEAPSPMHSNTKISVVMGEVPQARKRTKLDRRNSQEPENSFRKSLNLTNQPPVIELGAGIMPNKSNPLYEKGFQTSRMQMRSKLAKTSSTRNVVKSAPSASASMFKEALQNFRSGDSFITTTPSATGSIPAVASYSSLGINKVARVTPSVTAQNVNSLLLPPMDSPLKTYNITIHCLSTWGDTQRVTVSEIDILDEKRQPLPVVRVHTLPETDNSSRICDGTLIKNKVEDCWYARMMNDRGAIISIDIESMVKPFYIRLWNNQIDKDHSLKTFEVFVDTVFIYKGDLDNKFGQIIALSKTKEQDEAESNIHELIKEMSPEIEKIPPQFVDRYGPYPMKKVDRIEFLIMDTYNGMESIGINAMQFFDMEGNQITPPENTSISLIGIQSQTPFSKTITKSPEDSEIINQFYGDILDPVNVRIIIDFHKKLTISAVRIYNYNASGQECKQSIKRLKLIVWDQIVWVGSCKKGQGRKIDVGEFCTTIYFTPIIRKPSKI